MGFIPALFFSQPPLGGDKPLPYIFLAFANLCRREERSDEAISACN